MFKPRPQARTSQLSLKRPRLGETALAISFIALLAITWLIYQPAIPGFFILDDFDNLGVMKPGITDLATLHNYLTTGNAGPLGRPLSKLSFLLNDNAWPSTPESFKRTNLLIHLLIGVIIFTCCRLILQQHFNTKQYEWLALAITALWLTHPLQVSTVMYVVQRMTQLSSLFIMAGTLTHLWLRLKYPTPTHRQLLWLSLSLAGFTLAAALSKESGVLLPALLLITELTILAHRPTSPSFLWWRRICLLLPTTALIGYLLYLPRWINSYSARDFSLTERLLTQPVVLLDYLSSIISLRVSGLGLFHDDYPIYSSLLDPAATASLLVIASTILLAFIYRKRTPLLSFGVLWYFTGHLLESSTVALELYFEHRNYTPMLGPLVILIAGLHRGLHSVSSNLKRLPLLTIGSILAISALTTWGYANEWGAPERLLTIWATEHPNSPRAQRTYAHTQATLGHTEAALDTLDAAYERFPYDLSIPLISIDIACSQNIKPRYSIKELAKVTSQHRWTDGLRPALQSLFGRILETSCRDQAQDLHALTPALEQLEHSEHLTSGVAGFYVLDGDLYLREGKGNAALTSYQKVDELIPSASSMLRLSGFYLIVHDYKNAKESLLLARYRETLAGRNLSYRRKIEYDDKLKLIEKLLRTQTQNAKSTSKIPPESKKALISSGRD